MVASIGFLPKHDVYDFKLSGGPFRVIHGAIDSRSS